MAPGGDRLFGEIRITQRLISSLQQFAVRRASPGGTAEAAVSTGLAHWGFLKFLDTNDALWAGQS